MKDPGGRAVTPLTAGIALSMSTQRRSRRENLGGVTTALSGGRLDECVCVAFPALQAKAEGYTVYAVMDASGDMSEMASQTTLARMTQAGIIPVTTNVVLCDFQRTWAWPDAAQWGALYNELVPHYRAASESYQKAQEVLKEQKKQ